MALWSLTTATLTLLALRGERERRIANLLFVLNLIPFLVALGTFNTFLEQLKITLFFMLFVLLLVAILFLPRPAAAAMFLLGPLLVAWGAFRPYGLPASILHQSHALTFPPLVGHRVGKMTWNYAEGLRQMGPRHGATAETLLFDLSGTGPGNAVALGAKAPIVPRIVPVTPQIADVVWSRLTPKRRSEAWILGPIAPQFLSTQAGRAIAPQQERYGCLGERPMRV